MAKRGYQYGFRRIAAMVLHWLSLDAISRLSFLDSADSLIA
jgi:hypothetical protein